jgi:hypothetical protein
MQNETHPAERYNTLLQKHVAIQPNDDAVIASRLAADMLDDTELTLWALEQFNRHRLNGIDRGHRREATEAAKEGLTTSPSYLTALRQAAVLRGQIEATRGRVAERARVLREFGPYLSMAFEGAPLYSMTRTQILDIAHRRYMTGRTYQQQANYLRLVAGKLKDGQTVADAWTEADLAKLYVRRFKIDKAATPTVEAAE